MNKTNTQPWLQKKDWQENKIKSNAKLSVYVMWGFAIIWNLLSMPVLFSDKKLFSDITKNPENALILMFPAIGLVLIISAIHVFRKWRRFGPTPLMLDPWPGCIGGHVGGIVNNNVPFSLEHRYLVTLSCIHSYMSGSGKNRSRKEQVKWQTEGVCFTETSHTVNAGTRISFRFGIPENLPESDIKSASSYHLWRVHITGKLPGADFDRSFEIPVFRNSLMHSKDITAGTEDYHLTVDMAHEGVYEIAQITPVAGGIEMYYPPFTRPAGGIMALIFGLVFAAIGLVLSQVDDVPMIFPIVFTPVGLLIMLYGIWELGKSLRVKLDRDSLLTRRFFMKYPITSRQVPTNQVTQLEISEGSTMTYGSKTRVFYSLKAHTADGKKIVVAERLNSKPEVELVKSTVETYCGHTKG